MTLEKILQMGLRRTGLSASSDAYMGNALDYFNMGMSDVLQEREWNWALKSSTITTSASTRAYSLASDVMWPRKDSFRAQTNDTILKVIDLTETDMRDPDEDESGQQRRVVITGIDSSTGYWSVDLFPTPDTSSETIAYRYYKSLADKNLANDKTTDLAADLPVWVQRGLTFYISGHFKGEKGDLQGEGQDLAIYRSIIDRNADTDSEVDDLEPSRLGRKGDDFVRPFTFEVTAGSLT